MSEFSARDLNARFDVNSSDVGSKGNDYLGLKGNYVGTMSKNSIGVISKNNLSINDVIIAN